MVTASHNPPEYNGFKLCIGLDSIHGEDIQQIRQIIEKKAFVEGTAGLSSADVLPAYKEFVTSTVKISKPLKVGVDAETEPQALWRCQF